MSPFFQFEWKKEVKENVLFQFNQLFLDKEYDGNIIDRRLFVFWIFVWNSGAVKLCFD